MFFDFVFDVVVLFHYPLVFVVVLQIMPPVLCPKCGASFSRKDSMTRHFKKCTGPKSFGATWPQPSKRPTLTPPLPTFLATAAATTATPVVSAPLPSKRPRLDWTPCVPWRCHHFKVNGEPCLCVFGSKGDRALHENLHHLWATCPSCGVACRGERG